MHLTVTQEDIDNGVPCKSWRCPVALALQRALNDSSASVSPSMAYRANSFGHPAWTLSGFGRPAWTLNKEVRWFISDVDCGLPVYPITFLNFGEEII